MSKDDEAVETNEVDETTDQQAATGETNDAVETNDADDTAADGAANQDTNDTDEDIDYEAELLRVMGERDNWKQAALDEKDKRKKQRGSDDSDDTDLSDEDESAIEIITKRVEETVAAQLSQFQTSIVKDSVDSLLPSLTTDPKEQKLIKFHYENTINRTGVSKDAILSDLQNAQALANRARILKENEEMKVAMRNKKGINNTSRGSNQSRDNSLPEIRLSSADKALVQRLADKANMPFDEYLKKNRSRFSSN